MPLYEYKCDGCGDVFELIERFSDEPLTVHDKCGGPVHRLISRSALQFKGTGWYVTDYAKAGSGPNGSNKPGGESKSEGESKSGDSKSGSDSKSSEPTSGSESKSSSSESSGSSESSKKTETSKPVASSSEK